MRLFKHELPPKSWMEILLPEDTVMTSLCHRPGLYQGRGIQSSPLSVQHLHHAIPIAAPLAERQVSLSQHLQPDHNTGYPPPSPKVLHRETTNSFGGQSNLITKIEYSFVSLAKKRSGLLEYESQISLQSIGKPSQLLQRVRISTFHLHHIGPRALSQVLDASL